MNALTQPLFGGRNTKDQDATNGLVFLAIVKTKENSTMDDEQSTSIRVSRPSTLPIGFPSGRLKVIDNLGIRDAHGFALVACQCDCGNVVNVPATYVRTGKRVSCGCGKNYYSTHGHSKNRIISRTYRAWSNMITRCTRLSEDDKDFKSYQGRGICVCDQWFSFAAFLQDMGECPSGLEIDRIDVNGHYEPGNCRWVDNRTQARNKRNNHVVELHGDRMTIAELADRTGIKYRTLMTRIVQLGWTVEMAVTTPVGSARNTRRQGQCRIS